MTTGFNACVGVTPAGSCPMVDMAQADVIGDFIPATNDRNTSQIVVDVDAADEIDDSPYLEPTLRTESHTYYRLTGFGLNSDEDGVSCSTCEKCDVSDCLLSTFSSLRVDPYEHFWRGDQLCLRFALQSRKELEDIVGTLREAGYDVNLRHLSCGDSDFDPSSNALVSLDVLTPRQREAIRLAIECDYFRPGGADVDELATELDVSTSTFSKHVRIGVQKLVSQTFSE